MTQLSPEGSRAVEDIAHRTKFTLAAVTSMLFSIIAVRRGMRGLAIRNLEARANG